MYECSKGKGADQIDTQQMQTELLSWNSYHEVKVLEGVLNSWHVFHPAKLVLQKESCTLLPEEQSTVK